jgi:hypothetical protein
MERAEMLLALRLRAKPVLELLSERRFAHPLLSLDQDGRVIK